MIQSVRHPFLILLATLISSSSMAAAVCRPDATAPAAVATIRQVMATGRFIAYQPTSLQVNNGRLTQADPEGIREDLSVLRPRFDGLITYGATSGAEKIPDIAAQLGFRAVIMGIWDVGDPQALNNVIAAARRHPQLVVGVSVGNERVFANEISVAALTRALADMRKRAPQLAIATSEPFHIFLKPEAAALLRESDFLLPIVHPVHQPWFKSAAADNAADFVGNVLNDLGKVYCGPILVKETGAPTAPANAGFSPAVQADIYRALARRIPPDESRAFAYFSAFDAPWRVHDAMAAGGYFPEEAHWGLYTEKRSAKRVVEVIAPLEK